MKKVLVFLCAMSLVFGMVGIARANIIDLMLGEFSSPYHDTGTYSDEYLVGTFNFDLMGEEIIAAEISGQWGNSSSSTTAHNLLFVDDLQVANTHDYSPDPYYNTVPWSFTFTDFSVLEDGTAEFLTVQTSQYWVRLGETTLHIETEAGTAPVPEPATMLLLGSGLIGLAGLGRKFRKK